MTTLGQRLREARVEAGYKSQKALEDASGVKQQVISKIEQDKQDATSFIVRLAKACGVRPEWLETGELPKRPESYVFQPPKDNERDIKDRRGTYARRANDAYPETCLEAARLLAAIPDPQRTHLVETIRMVYTATVAINHPTIAAMLPGIQDQERHEFYERWIEARQAEYRAGDVKSNQPTSHNNKNEGDQ